MIRYTSQQICDLVDGHLEGPSDLTIHGIDQLSCATADQITFLRDGKHAKHWAESNASVALVTEGVDVEAIPGRALIRVADADLAVAEILRLFAAPQATLAAGTHPSATVDAAAKLAPSVALGPGCYVGPDVKIGPDSVLHANVTVLDATTIGNGCTLYPGVVVRERCEIGSRVTIHPNAVIGTDGFGYRPDPGGSRWVKIPQIGSVVIEDDVEIGAGTCIDRGKFSATVIGQGTKIDNLCHIAHNCRIGRHCVLAAQVGLSGGVKVEDWAVIAGQVGIVEHLNIGAAARIGAKSGVMDDVPAGESWMGIPAHDTRKTLREWAAVRRLPDLWKALKKIELVKAGLTTGKK